MLSIAVAVGSSSWAEALAEAVKPIHVATTAVGSVESLAHSSVKLAIVDAELIHRESRILSPTSERPPIVLMAEEGDYDAVVLALKARAADFWVRSISVKSAVVRIEDLLADLIPSPHYLARRIDRFLQENHSRVGLCTRAVAREFGITPNYVSRLMNLDHWSGFRRRLLVHRVRHAEALLVETDLPLYLIADSCGFRSPCRFSEAFAREVGVPPKRFRAGARPLTNVRPILTR